MTLQELRKSLAKFGGDFQDYHVLIQTMNADGQKEYNLVCGVGHAPDFNAIFLIDENSAQEHLDRNK